MSPSIVKSELPRISPTLVNVELPLIVPLTDNLAPGFVTFIPTSPPFKTVILGVAFVTISKFVLLSVPI